MAIFEKKKIKPRQGREKTRSRLKNKVLAALIQSNEESEMSHSVL